MRKKTRWLAFAVCLSVFASLALGSGSSDSDKKVVTNDEKKEEEAAKVSIDQQVLVDQNDVVITATEYVTDGTWGEGIKVTLENKSATNVTVGCKALIVNDYMINDLFSCDVAAGKKSNDTIYLSSSELKAAGIDTVGQVEIYFNVYNTASYENIFDTDCITIQTSAYADMDTTPNDMGTELYNEGGVKIVGKTVDENSFWGAGILLYCENTTDRRIGFSVENFSVNGYMIDPLFSATVYGGKKSIDEITLFSSDLEDNGIKSIDQVELTFHIYDNDSYDTIADSEPITFSAK